MTGESTRRGFLAVVGGTALAGCSGFDGFSDDTESTVSTSHLRELPDEGESEPIVAESIPVAIEQSLLNERLRRVSDLLESVPVPLSQERIPNGVIRERLLHAADEAATYGQRARSAQTPLSALQSLSRAREQARYAAAGWAYVAHDRTESELQTAHQQAVADARTLQTNLSYRADDPVRAALVYAHLERNLAVVLGDPAPTVTESSPLLAVAEWGEHAESARARVADARRLSDQYTASLSGDATDAEATLTTAADTLATRLQERRAALPPEPTELDDGLGGRLRYRLRDDAESLARRVREPAGPARAVVTAVGGLAAFAAYDQVRARLEENGTDAYAIEDAADVREFRTRALDSIRTALEESPRPALARPALADAALAVTYADDTLARYRGEVRMPRLYDPARRYIAAAARAQNVPAACHHVRTALHP